MLRLMVTVGKDEWVFGFPQNDIVVGASPKSGLVLDHETVAVRHARITQQGGKTTVVSLAPGRPTRVNEAEVQRSEVKEGDIIDIGAYRLEVVHRDPPGPQEKAFLEAIARAPQDDEPRAVYGDWLEEHGRIDDAQFLRAQIAVRSLAADDMRFLELSSTIRRLAPRMSLAWRRAVARPLIENCGVQFELECPKTWDELQPTAKPEERFCKTCQKPVHYANNIETARRLAIVGQCVSVDLVVPRAHGDLRPPPPVRMMGAIMPRYRDS